MKRHTLLRIQRIFSVALILSLVLSLFSPVILVRAEDPFPLPDRDSDGLDNDIEQAGWYTLSGVPYQTDPDDPDSDDDGLTDGEEKLFNTNPLDSHDPGLAVKYADRYKTRQYFSTTDPAYLSMIRGGDQYLLVEAMVARRGTTLHIAGPASGSLAITGTGMTALNPQRDPARGGWTVILPPGGTVGTYTATVTDGAWSQSMPLYVIFELPASLAADEVAAYLYDDDPANLKDEVAVWWRMGEWPYYGNYQSTVQPCPGTDPNTPCSLWQYHLAYGYAQAFWTQQFTKSAFVDHAIKAIHGKTSPALAAPAIASWTDYEFRTRSGRMQNNWSSAIYKWNDGTGLTMSGGYCETTSTVYTTLLRSAGIAARPFTLDYNKTSGHGESGQIGTMFEYDHAVMLWLDNTWKAQRAYNRDEVSDLYYPWNYGTTGISTLETWDTYSGYYNDYYGDTIVSANEDWTFQTSTGVGTVNTAWNNGVPSTEFVTANRDYQWASHRPLQITQSPHVDLLNCQMWLGDNWAPGEWRTPILSNPADRDETLTYYLPSGVPDPATPLENWPYNPQVTACSPSTPSAECSAFRAAWSAVCQPLIESSMMSTSLTVETGHKLFFPVLMSVNAQQHSIVELGNITADYGFDRDGDDYFDELLVDVEVSSQQEGEYQFGGWLKVGEQYIRAMSENLTLVQGSQTVTIAFDGQQIADANTDGPYEIEVVWVAAADQPILAVVQPDQLLDYKTYTYSTSSYAQAAFEIQAATIGENYGFRGVDVDGNGLYDSLVITVDLDVNVPGDYTLEGSLYDAGHNFLGRASWTGEGELAALDFSVSRSQPPFSLEQLSLYSSHGELLDSRFAPVYEISGLDGRIETSGIIIGSGPEIDASGTATHDVTPNNFTITPVDTNGNGLYDKLQVRINVTSTESGSNYRVEGLLIDAQGMPVAWSVSSAQTLVVGNQNMLLEFDGRMLYDQLPVGSGSESWKLVAVKISNGSLSSATLKAQVAEALNTPAYSRSQFEPSSSAEQVFQDDLENGTDLWTWSLPMWSADSNIWHSWTHAWVASASSTMGGTLSLADPLDLTEYAGPVLRFNHAHLLLTPNDTANLEVSTDGVNWTNVASYSGSTLHWDTEMVDLSAYGETAGVQIRFRANAQSGLLWYLDDVYLNAWPAVTSAAYTYSPDPVEAGIPVTFNASYTSNNTNLPINYIWDFGGVIEETTSPEIVHTFVTTGDTTVTLTVENPHDSATYTQTIFVNPAAHQYTLTLIAAPADGGTLSKTPDSLAYNPGEVVTVSAEPADGYMFAGWNGACSGIGACVVTMDDDKIVTGTFTLIDYTLSAGVTGNGSVLKNPDQATYHYGENVELTAVPGSGWAFSEWTGDLSGSENPAMLTITDNHTVTANFVEGGYTLTVNTTGNGSVSKTPDLAAYPDGQLVTLAATPDPGWSFTGWGGDCSGTDDCLLTMDGNKTVTATFTEDTYSLDIIIDPVEGGTVTRAPDQSSYTYGTEVLLTATANPGYSFTGWSGGGCAGTSPCLLVIDDDTQVAATFTQNEYTLNTSQIGQGSIVVSPDQATYTYGQEVTFEAIPATGWVFTGWGGACSGTDMCVLTIEGNTNVSATFTAIDYTMTVTIVGEGTVSRDIEGPYHYGDVVELSAVPNPGWSFDHWSGDLEGNSNPATITIVGDMDVTATFSMIYYYLYITVEGNGHVDIDPEGPYTYHEMPLMTAVPDPGWYFVEWTGDRTGTTNPMAITMSSDKYVTAHFASYEYSFTTNVIGEGTISKSPEQTSYIWGDEVTVTAIPAPGWSFVEWSGSCTGSGACVVTVNGDESVTATFMENIYTLDVTVSGAGNVTKDPDLSAYSFGTLVTLTATADFGWIFDGWSGDLTGSENTAQITMDGSKAVTATFSELACYVPELIASIETANASGVPTTITLDSNCTYELDSPYAADPDGYGPVGLPPITGEITLVGNNTIINRSATEAFRFFYVTTSASLELEEVSLTNGLAQGGDGGHAQYDGAGGGGGMGGAIFNRGTLTLNNVSFVGNSAQGGLGGNDNTVVVSADAGGGGMGGVGQNAPGGNLGGAGGGINGGAGGIVGAISGGDGGIGGGGGGAAYSGSHGDGGDGGFGGGGGGGNNGGTGGFGGGGGGGQVGYGGSAGLGGFGGGAGAAWVGGGGAGLGGAIFNDGGTLIVLGGTFTDNTAIGGNGTVGTGATGGGGSGYGGAIFNHQGMLQLTDPNFIDNSVVAGTGGVAGFAIAPDVYDLFNLTASIVGHGSIVIDPGLEQYIYGQEVTLTPVAEPGWTFIEWTGDCAGQGEICTLAMYADKAVSASFSQIEYSLTITAVDGTVSVTPEQATYHYDDVVTLEAIPDPGFSFSSWSGDLTGSTNPAQITITGNMAVTANFTQDAYTLAIEAVNGTVNRDPDQASYAYGALVTLTPAADPGYSFAGWSGADAAELIDNGDGSWGLVMDGDKSLIASFSQIEYSLTVVSDHGVVSVDPDLPTYVYGTEVLLTMGAVDPGWTFTGWSGGGCSGTDPCTLTITDDTSVTASFSQIEYSLTVVSDHGVVSVDPDLPTYVYGTEVLLTMGAVDPGWTFTGWSGGGCSGTDPCTLTITDDTSVTASFSQIEYSLTVVSDHGVVSVDPDLPTYVYGTEVLLTMGAVDPGWTFTGWSGGGCSGTDPCTLTITDDTSVTASFSQIEYSLTVVSDHGVVSVDPDLPTYVYGTEVLLTMGAVDPGWTFTGWSGGGCSGTDPCTLTITDDTSVTASFSQIEYSLTITAVDGTVSVTPEQATYHYDDVVTLEAIPDPGFSFSSWSGDLTGSTNPAQITITGNMAVTANFTQDAYTLAIEAVNGTVNRDPDQASYAYGALVTLTPAADPGYSFAGWSGADAAELIDNGDGSWGLVMDGDKSLIASFSQIEYSLTVVSDHGVVSVDPDLPTYVYGTEVLLTMGAVDPGWTFTGWSGGGCSGTDPCTLTITDDTSVTASFSQIEYSLTVVSDHGVVSVDPDLPTYVYGTEVLLTMGAVDPGWTFTGWSGGGCSGTDPCTLTITDDTSVTASFSQIEYSLTITAVDGTVSVTPEQATYHYDDVVTLEAIPDPGFSFSSWSGDLTGSTNPAQITITGNMAVTANFTQDAYTLAIEAVNGTVNRDPDQASYAYGALVTLTPAADPGYSFAGWSGADAAELIDNGDGSWGLVMDGDKSLIASFSQIEYSLTVVSDHGVVSVDPDLPTYVYGTEVLLTMGAVDPGWTFTGWSGGGCSGTDPCTLTITDDTSVTASFSQIEYSLTVVSDHGVVSVDPDLPTYVYGTEVLLTMGAVDPGWTFTGWSGGGCSGTDPCTLTITDDTSVTASFSQIEYSLTITAVDGTVSVTPEQATYHYDDVVTLEAIPDPGFSFSSWSGDLTGSTNPAQITITGNMAVTANFTQDAYTLAIEAVNGTVNRDPDQASYAYGALVTLTPAADPGYSFAGWSGADAAELIDNGDGSWGLVMDGDKSLIASFSQIEYSLTVVSDHGVVSVDPDLPTYVYGTEVLLTMGAVDPGWTFTGWSGGGCSGTDPCTLTITDDTSVTASFSQIEYSLTVVSDHGVVSVDPDLPTYVYGTEVLLTMGAVDPGWTFTGWSGGGCSGTDPCTLTITDDTSVTASFSQIEYSLTVVSDHGVVSVDPDLPTYVYGTEVLLTMGAVDPGWTFTGWSGGGCSGTDPCTLTITDDTSVTASFSQIEYSLTITAVDGTVSVTPEQATYHYDDVVTLEAIPDPGFSFSSWSGDLTGSTNPAQITITGNMAVTANFTVEPCSVAKLIADIYAANGNPDPVTITLESGCVYVLTEPAQENPDGNGPVGLPMITGDITIFGNGATVTRSGDITFRFLVVSPEGSLTLKNVVIGEVVPLLIQEGSTESRYILE